VFKKTIGSYLVRSGDRMIPCTLSSRLRKEFAYAGGPQSARRAVREVQAIEHVAPVAVGDVVRFVDAHDGSGQIVEVLPRRNQLSRQTAVPMPDARPFEHVIVANMDQVVPVFAVAEPAPHWNMLDRYLVAAEAKDLPAVICLTKLDLVQVEGERFEAEIEAEINEYQRIGYPVVLTSVKTGQGLAELRAALQERTSVLLGKSGVGKSSLLNALQPGLGLRVNEVSQATGRGKHTTTHLEMFALEFGGAIVDTPGVREFGLWDLDVDNLEQFFPEMRPFFGRCRFGLDCWHVDEPGCAIRKAVTAGQISPRRFQSFLRLREDA
jgi:ribosome biogenesis GTPase